jgi:hypothetical protein
MSGLALSTSKMSLLLFLVTLDEDDRREEIYVLEEEHDAAGIDEVVHYVEILDD